MNEATRSGRAVVVTPGWQGPGVHIDGEILRLARRQFGVLSRGQLFDVGLSSQQVDRRIRAGMLVRIHRAVYVTAASPLTFETRAMAALLAAGPGAAVSHGAAGRLLDIRGSRAYRRVHVTIPGSGGVPVIRGVTVHRSLTLDRHDAIERHGIRLTRPERTIVDSAGQVSTDVAKRILDGAISQGYTTIDRLWLYLTRYRSADTPAPAP